jgi:amino-acid N-acetyltransferase
MTFAEQVAAEKGMKQVFALSTQAFNYFQQKGGYNEVSPELMPSERRKKWEASARNSKVMSKTMPSVLAEAPRT